MNSKETPTNYDELRGAYETIPLQTEEIPAEVPQTGPGTQTQSETGRSSQAVLYSICYELSLEVNSFKQVKESVI